MAEVKSENVDVQSSASADCNVDSEIIAEKSDSTIGLEVNTEEDASGVDMKTKQTDPKPEIEENTNSASKTEKVLIIDAGSRMIRIGILGQGGLKVVSPNVVGHLKKTFKTVPGQNPKKIFFGEEAEGKIKTCDICYPVRNGVIAELDALADVLTYTFQNNLDINVSEYKIVMKAETEDRDALLDLLFKTYNPPAVLLANQASLSLFAIGGPNGLIVVFGEGTSQIVPIFDNRILQNAVDSWGCNGQRLTEKLMGMLEIDETPAGHKRAREIKEKYCYVASDPKTEMANVQSEPVDLPDGREKQIGSERFECPEVLFQEFHIHEVIVKAIKNCEEDKQKELFKNIVLAGGSTMLKGFPERLEKEIKAVVGDETDINIIALPDRMHSAWNGGLKVASNDLFPNNWITRDDFEKKAEIIQSKYI